MKQAKPKQRKQREPQEWIIRTVGTPNPIAIATARMHLLGIDPETIRRVQASMRAKQLEKEAEADTREPTP